MEADLFRAFIFLPLFHAFTYCFCIKFYFYNILLAYLVLFSPVYLLFYVVFSPSFSLSYFYILLNFIYHFYSNYLLDLILCIVSLLSSPSHYYTFYTPPPYISTTLCRAIGTHFILHCSYWLSRSSRLSPPFPI
jgi:hypothetical protein